MNRPYITYLKRSLKKDGSEAWRRNFDCTHYADCLKEAADNNSQENKSFVCECCVNYQGGKA